MDVVALRHVGFEDLGVWDPALTARGASITYLQAGVDALEPLIGADLAVVMGGPISAYDARYPFVADEIAAVRARLDRDAPTLGVCLGAQVMAAAAGARVYPGQPELGWGAVELTLAGAAGPLGPLAGAPVLHWHGDTFELADGAALLASTAANPHQAFSLGKSLALQFHVEVDARAIDTWLVGHAHELAATGVDVVALRAESHRVADEAARAGTAVLAAYLDGIGA